LNIDLINNQLIKLNLTTDDLINKYLEMYKIIFKSVLMKHDLTIDNTLIGYLNDLLKKDAFTYIDSRQLYILSLLLRLPVNDLILKDKKKEENDK
jgi:hypothetical protein